MRVVSVNAGRPREVFWRDRLVRTAIFKHPVDGAVAIRRHNLDGDGQADLSVHGGPDKAVYAYATGHYTFWRTELQARDLEWGSFGENLTVDDFTEDGIRIGDEFQAGTARLVVTQPRLPCYKLNLRLNRNDMIDRMLDSGRTRAYFAVLAEGEVQCGDPVEMITTNPAAINAADAAGLFTDRTTDVDLLRRAIDTPHLAASWRERFRRKLDRLEERIPPQLS